VHLGVLDAILVQPLGDLGRHQVRHRHRLAVFGCFELAGDALIGHDDLGDLVLCEQFFELAVGQDLDGLGLLPPLLDEEDCDQREQQVADVELGALFHHVEMGAITPLSKQE